MSSDAPVDICRTDSSRVDSDAAVQLSRVAVFLSRQLCTLSKDSFQYTFLHLRMDSLQPVEVPRYFIII